VNEEAKSPDQQSQCMQTRGAEKLMDDYLKSIGLHRKKIAKDGSCLFRAVAEQVNSCSVSPVLQFIEGDFDDYLYKLQDPQVVFVNFQVQLCFLNGNHYDSVYPIGRIKSAALCQSILYELLYDGVFKVDRSVLGSCQRGARHTDLLTDDNMAACGSSDESDGDAANQHYQTHAYPLNCLETISLNISISQGRGRRGPPLHERLRRSLNPALFRNVEYDVWHKTKRAQQKMDYCIAAGMQFAVGDRCQVRLDGSGRSYSATIKEVPPSDGPVTVFIEELGRKQVPLWNLRPPSDENSWSTVVSRDKRLSNGHGGCRPLGSGGRVQKQHSWPMQATIEEQGGVKPSR
uniref:Uncharacterized protein n=1 Tax=Mola mola TaxID=94237 RepID=A0A3Q3WU64_MOLML